jgi:hypothetical protein
LGPGEDQESAKIVLVEFPDGVKKIPIQRQFTLLPRPRGRREVSPSADR